MGPKYEYSSLGETEPSFEYKGFKFDLFQKYLKTMGKDPEAYFRE